MIQELLGGLVERKVSIPDGLLGVDGSSTTSSSSLSSTNISAPSSSASSSPSSASETQQNLRCPRCDSSNTKFCYYNNYNLTQPRHFCKTCRRYWTKGGALRNVPIGGGCRKAKPTGIPVATSTGGKSGGGKAKPPSPDLPILGKPSLGGVLDHELPSSPVLWASPHTSQLLALLRATSIPNPNPNPSPSPSPITSLNSVRVKEDEATIVSHMVAEPMAALNAQNLSLDPLGQLTIGPCGSLWRNGSQNLYQQQAQLQPQPQQQNMLGEAPSSGIQELYQRLRSSTSYYNDPLQMVASNMGSSASNASTVTAAATMPSGTSTTAMEPIHLNGGEFGYWNPAFLWTDLPTANGAFP